MKKSQSKGNSFRPNVTFKNVKHTDWILATRAAEYIMQRPRQRDAILEYENGTSLWVEWSKAGNIIVRGPTLNG